MSDDELLLLGAACAAASVVVATATRKRRRKRSIWVRQMFQRRNQLGAYNLLMAELRTSDVEKLSFYGLFCGLQICQKCIGGWGSAPDPTGGPHDAPPDLGWGGGHQSQCPTPLAPTAPRFSRFRHFDPRAPC